MYIVDESVRAYSFTEKLFKQQIIKAVYRLFCDRESAGGPVHESIGYEEIVLDLLLLESEYCMCSSVCDPCLSIRHS